MTRNQRRAAQLAEAVCASRVDPTTLSDPDWHLLLLAAELNNPFSRPSLVCRRVLDRATRGVGYFTSTARRPSRYIAAAQWSASQN